MILTLILKTIVGIISLLFEVVPKVSIANIPFIGTYIYYYVGVAISYVNTMNTIIPYFAIVWQMFLWIISFEIMLLLLKLFLGSRTPLRD